MLLLKYLEFVAESRGVMMVEYQKAMCSYKEMSNSITSVLEITNYCCSVCLYSLRNISEIYA
jgi:hypothetical protein